MVLEYDQSSKDTFEAIPKEDFQAAKEGSLVNRGKVVVAGKLYSLLYFVDESENHLGLNERTKYVSTEMKHLLARASGIDALADKLGDAIFEDSCAAYLARHVYAFSTLDLCIRDYFNMTNQARALDVKYVLTSRSKGYNMLAILTFLASLPNFVDCLVEYSRDMDTGVEFAAPDQLPGAVATSNWSLYFDSTAISTVHVVFNQDEWKVLAFLIVYCFNKTGEPNNLLLAIMKRLSAIKNAGHLRFDSRDFMEKVDLTSLVGIYARLSQTEVHNIYIPLGQQ